MKKTCVVTGANAGIGRATAEHLARAGHRVIMACRNLERADVAAHSIRQELPDADVKTMLLDVSRLQSVRAFAKAALESNDHVDVLINNAGFVDSTQKHRVETGEGIEVVWATNHLGHVLLTDLLMPALSAAHQGRIIVISSKGLVVYPRMRVDLHDPEFQRRKFSVVRAYYQSKFAQVCWLLQTAQQLEGGPVTINGVRVTNVANDVARYPNASWFDRLGLTIKNRLAISPEEMADTYVWLATAPELAEVNGGYFDEKRKDVAPNRFAADVEHARAVMELTRRYFDSGPSPQE